jgi:hypothetical protein
MVRAGSVFEAAGARSHKQTVNLSLRIRNLPDDRFAPIFPCVVEGDNCACRGDYCNVAWPPHRPDRNSSRSSGWRRSRHLLGCRARIAALPQITDVSSDLLANAPQLKVTINRDQASRFGISAQMIDDTLNDAYGQRQITQYFTQLKTYWIILESRPTSSATSPRSTGST